jgi:hypothetical protein
MKNIIFLLFLTLSPLLVLSQASGTFTITDIKVELNNTPQEVQDPKIDVELTEDQEQVFRIYANNDLSFLASFEYARSGKRVKLVRYSGVERGRQKHVKSKKKKDVQFIKVGVPGTISKQFSETILYDKDNMSAIFVNFKYEFNYR